MASRKRQWICVRSGRWCTVRAASPESACKKAFGLAAGYHWQTTPLPVVNGTAAFDCEKKETVWLHEEDNG